MALPPCDVIVHLAAHAKVHALVERPLGALENHLMVTNALELARVTGTPIVLASSREVYGQQPRDRWPGAGVGRRSSAPRPSPYAAAKLASEALAAAYHGCYGLPYLVFRFSNVYGRYDNDLDRLERVLWIFAREISRGAPITVFGSEKLLDFTYVDDAVDGLWRGIERLVGGTLTNETFNLAYGAGNRLTTLANAHRHRPGAGATHTDRAVPSRRSDLLRRRHHPRSPAARLRSTGEPTRGRPSCPCLGTELGNAPSPYGAGGP